MESQLAAHVRLILRCAGCGVPWDAEHEGDWQVFFTCAVPPQPVAYCPGCRLGEPRPSTD